MKLRSLIPLLFLLAGNLLYGQVDSLQPIYLKVKPPLDLDKEDLRIPFALSRKEFNATQNSKQQLSLEEYLQGIPGLFVLNKNNYSQDLRISLRGFGARSAFGIRGIKIIVDGIPETTPDGQGQIDNLVLGIIDNIQVLRGPASLLYGNAAGGVININTRSQIDSTYVQAGYVLGNYQMSKFNVTAGIKHKNGTSLISGSRTSTNGYREASGFESNQFNFKSNLNLSEKSSLTLQLNYTDSPLAQDAGGLTLTEATVNRRQARSQNVLFDGSEQVRQLKTGVSYQHQWEKLSVESYGFYSYRDFENKLPFQSGGQVQLYRNYYGHGTYVAHESKFSNAVNKLQLGYAIAFQADQRSRFDNLQGDRGNLGFQQLESYNNYGMYLVDRLELGNWSYLAGIRYDINSLKANDKTDAGNSDSRNLNSWSGSLGINYYLNTALNLYANLSTSFETPALSELSANPDGSTGFNPDLEPQRAVNYEVGIKNSYKRTQVTAAVFLIDTSDDLVPFELGAFPGRTFYRNAGKTRRYGLELSANTAVTNTFSLEASYTYSDFSYRDFQVEDLNLSGKNLPGIPQHLATLGATYQKSQGLFAQLNTTYRGSLYADDGNETRIQEAFITDLNLSYPFKIATTTFTLVGGINNLFNTRYFDNVRINAFGGRYYEPAPGINFYTGVRLRI